MDKRCIVFYDSGSGGLNLFERTRKVFPNENYIYFADEKNLPFGDKTEEELNVVFDRAIETINSFGPKLLVVACNTMSCCAENRFTVRRAADAYPVQISLGKVPYAVYSTASPDIIKVNHVQSCKYSEENEIYHRKDTYPRISDMCHSKGRRASHDS